MNEIEAIRHVRHAGQVEPVLSSLTCAIGDVERLGPMDDDQMVRLRQAVIRLSNEERKRSRG